jgi:hypothetical protein
MPARPSAFLTQEASPITDAKAIADRAMYSQLAPRYLCMAGSRRRFFAVKQQLAKASANPPSVSASTAFMSPLLYSATRITLLPLPPTSCFAILPTARNILTQRVPHAQRLILSHV